MNKYSVVNCLKNNSFIFSVLYNYIHFFVSTYTFMFKVIHGNHKEQNQYYIIIYILVIPAFVKCLYSLFVKQERR